MDIFITGRTDPGEVNIISPSRIFAVNEYFILDDPNLGKITGEVVKTYSVATMDEGDNVESLRRLDLYGALNGATLKILNHLDKPVSVDSTVRTPVFQEIEHLLMPTKPKDGFLLGVIKGTQDMHQTLPEEYQNISPLWFKNKIIPQQGIPFALNHLSQASYPHIGLFGSSGSGKTTGLRVICEEIMNKRIPGILLDPHLEMDFGTQTPGMDSSLLKDYSRNYEIFYVGKDVGISFPDLKAEELVFILEYAGALTDPMQNAVRSLHQSNDSEVLFKRRISLLIKAFENAEVPKKERANLDEQTVLLYEQYKNSVAGVATLRAIAWRLQTLIDLGIFQCDTARVETAIRKRKLAVIRGNMNLLQVFSGYLMRKIYRKRRDYRDFEQKSLSERSNDPTPEKIPPFFVITDEAHNFAPKGDTMTPTKQIMREIAQEGRKYGVFLIPATQRPALLDTTITAMLNTKIIFRTNIESDMRMIKTETNLTSEEVSRLPDLPSGTAFVSTATLAKTLSVQFRACKTVSPHTVNPFSELDDLVDEDDLLRKILIRYLPLSIETIPKKHAAINTEARTTLSLKDIQELLELMADDGEIIKEVTPLGIRYIQTKF